MWLWESELRSLGFRRKSERYWQCERRFGLPACGHLSAYSWSEHAVAGERLLAELSTFHVTFEIGHDNVHFYYHERLENEWEPAGHTTSAEITRLGHDPLRLRAWADAVAARLVAALGSVFHPRPEGRA
jgi:hypothetical protein